LPDASEGWVGFSLLVDDVERYAGAALNYSLAALQAGIPHFFRLAVSYLSVFMTKFVECDPYIVAAVYFISYRTP
jgi:hypothetical protein